MGARREGQGWEPHFSLPRIPFWGGVPSAWGRGLAPVPVCLCGALAISWGFSLEATEGE